MQSDALHFLYVDVVSDPGNWEFRPHKHPFHELVLVTNGEMTVGSPSETITARSRDLLFYPAGTEHDEKPSRKHPVQMLFMAFEWKGDVSDLVLRTTDERGKIRFLMNWLYEEGRGNSGLHPDMANAFTTLIIHELSGLSCNQCPSLVSRVRALMRSKARDPLTLDELAREAKMSKYHFIRRYKNMTGRTPAADLRLIRLDMARELLLTTELPLKEIAARVGLVDEFHLSRTVRKYLGATASSLRNRPRKKAL